MRLTHFIFLFLLFGTHVATAQCPEFDSATLSNGDTFCGEELGLLLSAAGSSFPNCDGEVTWMIGEPGFDPMTEGTELGVSDVISSCNNDIEVLYLNINPDNNLVGGTGDCGNEFLVIYSGDGVYTDDFTMEFSCPGIFDTFGAGDASVYTGCGGLVEVNQGDFIPANAIIIVQIADGANPPTVNYDITSLCNTGLDIYVIQVLSNCGFGCLDNSEPCGACPYPISEGCCGSSDNVFYSPGPSTNGMGWSNLTGIDIYGEVVADVQLPSYTPSIQTVDDLNFDLTQSLIDQYCTPISTTLEIVGVLNDVGATCGPILSDPIMITLICPQAEDAGPLEECTDPDTGDASFDLTQLENTVIGSNSGDVEWYIDLNLVNQINDPSNYETDNDETVYATVVVNGCESVPVAVELFVSESPTISWDNSTESFCENDCVEIPFTISGGDGPYQINIQGTVQLAGIFDIDADCNFTVDGSDVLTICLTHTPISIIPPSAGYNCDPSTNTLELPSNLLDWISPDSGPLMVTSIEDLSSGCFGEYEDPDVVVTYLDNCNIACATVQDCDDNNPCTENDQETIGGDGGICEPCTGTLIDCNSGSTSTEPCDDGDANTINDMQEVLDCDGSICEPCMGVPTDCDTGATTTQPCDDGNPCTINEMETILDSDGSICEPCEGVLLDCDTGATSMMPCDDGDPNTINDMQLVLDCDGSICEACSGTTTDCDTGSVTIQPCDDGDACTINDMETILDSDGTVCEPCMGVEINCNTGSTTEVPCDDGDPNTENDMMTILDCDGSECIPCAGTDVNCDSGATTTQMCDDNNPCTINDMETILDSDGSICEPCIGVQAPCGTDVTCELTQSCDDGNPCTSGDEETILLIDGSICLPCQGVEINCSNGATTTSPCDDGDPITENDMITTLDCDGSICEPCEGNLPGCQLNVDIVEVICNDNGTPTDDSDDFLSITIVVTNGSQIGTYNIETGTTQILSNTYGDSQVINLNPGSAGGGDINMIVSDELDPNCTDSFIVIDPGSCDVNPDCLNGATMVVNCDDQNPCTEMDQATILVADGTECEPCMGITIDCINGATTTLPCDDNNPNTVDDQVVLLDCDESICEPCIGTPIVVDVYIPNVISTNSDAGNSEFRIFSNQEVDIVNLDIYDRWGNRVFGVEGVDINDEQAVWNGTFKSKDVESGVYVYLLVYTFNESETSISGDVLVLH